MRTAISLTIALILITVGFMACSAVIVVKAAITQTKINKGETP